jgi:hypothetical protein
MDDPNAESRDRDNGTAAWFGFWAQFIVLGLLAVAGALFASAGRESGDYATGLVLALSAIALAFLRLKHFFDGRPGGWTAFLLVDDMRNLALVVPVFAIVGLIGLFIAAAAPGSLHGAGIGLFVVSGAIVFLSLKRVFDNLDTRR